MDTHLVLRHLHGHKKVMLGHKMKDILGTAAIGVPVVNEITDQGIITALNLESIVVLGLTYGAWFKIGMGVALILLIVERGLSIWSAFKHRFTR